MNDSVCCLPLKSVSGSEKSRLDHDGNQQVEVCSICSKWWPLALTHARIRIRHWSTALSITLYGTDDVVATPLLRHFEILQGKVSLQEVQ